MTLGEKESAIYLWIPGTEYGLLGLTEATLTLATSVTLYLSFWKALLNRAWWYTPTIPALERERRED